MNVYICPKCHGSYQRQSGATHVSCAVMHAPGDCCHYGEPVVTNEQLRLIREALRP